MSSFKHFVDSPYFCRNKDQKNLVAYLQKLHPRFTAEKVDRKMIAKNVMASASIPRKRLDLLFSRTYALFKQFSAVEAFQEDPLRESIFMLKSLHDRELRSLFDREQVRALNAYEKYEIKDAAYYMAGYELGHEIENYHMHYSRLQESKNFLSKIGHLDHFYFAQKLKDACEMSIRKRVLDLEYESILIDAVIAEIEANLERYNTISPILLYYYVYKMLSTEDPSFYYLLIESLDKHQSEFQKEEQLHLYSFAKNFCVQQVNLGREEFLSNLFEVYKRELKNNLLFADGQLSEWHYKNIVTVGIRLEEFDWTYHFLEEHKDRLPAAIAENAYRFNLANYHHAVGEYDKTLMLLQDVEFTDVRYSLGAKALLLRNFYESGDFEPLLSSSEAFRNYLRRNKLLSGERKEGYLNLIRFTVKAAKINNQMAFLSASEIQKQAQKLHEEIRSEKAVFNAKWILAKVKEIIE